jgi:excisionase family DNA binding protein
MESNFPEGAILTLKEASLFLKICTKTMLNLIECHAIKAFKVGRQWRIRKSAIDEYLSGFEDDYFDEGQSQ